MPGGGDALTHSVHLADSSASISPVAGEVRIVSLAEHVRMIKQSQAKAVRPVRIAAVAVTAGVMTIVAACSSGTGTASSSGSAAARTTTGPAGSGSPMSNQSPPMHSGSGSPAASRSACKHVNSARKSLESLAHLQLSGSSAGKIRTDLTGVQKQLAVLKGKTSGALASQIDALSASLKQVEKAALGIHSSPSASQITAVVSSLHALKTQSRATLAAMHAA